MQPSALFATPIERIEQRVAADGAAQSRAIEARERVRSDLIDQVHDLPKLAGAEKIAAERLIVRLRLELGASEEAVQKATVALEESVRARTRAKAEIEAAAEMAKLKRIPDLADQQLDLARQVDRTARDLGKLMFSLARNSEELAGAIGSPAALRRLSLAALRHRLQQTLYNCFEYRIERGKSAENFGVGSQIWWFPYHVDVASPMLRQSLTDVTIEILDDVVSVYAAEDVARAVARRKDPSGKFWHAVEDMLGFWRVVQGVLRGEARRHAAKVRAET